MRAAFVNSYLGVALLPPIFAAWAAGTIAVMGGRTNWARLTLTMLFQC